MMAARSIAPTVFREGVAGFDEVFLPHGRAFVRQAFAEAEKAALGCPGGLITQLAISDLALVNSSSELACHAVGVLILEREQMLLVHSTSSPFEARSNEPTDISLIRLAESPM